jgi:dolichol-phosphate mannosyltransferase
VPAAAPGSMDPWVILPTYNEAENLARIVDAVLEQLPDAGRVLVVDDNSPDGTGEIADRLAASNPAVSVLHAGAGRIVEMDADFSHDPVYLPKLIGAADHFDLVIGSRYVPGGGVTEWGPLRRFISRGGSAYARISLGLPIRDLTGGFKCFRREVLEAIDLDTIEARGYAFQVETTYRAIKAGFRVVEIPIVFKDRAGGTSKMSRSIVAEAMWRVPAMRFRRR